MSGIEGLLAGHTLAGRYRVDEVIGRGGFAAVYLAHDDRLQRTVAVKVVMVAAPGEGARDRIRARFHREAQVAASLQHPNVVTIYDFGTDEKLGLDFLVMELLHGEDLAKRIARLGPPPMEQSLRILREAAEGLAAGHHAGLVHRDVKPSNVFLEERTGTDVFRVCVLDFGIAQILEGDEAITSLTGSRMPLSPAYAAPEHLRDERPLTRAADVYGLGMIGYELLTGERPFAGTSEESARRVVPSLRAANPEVPEAVAAVIEKALSYEAAARYPDAGDLARALRVAQMGHDHPGPLDATWAMAGSAPPQAEEPRYRARRHPRLREESPTPVPAPSPRRAPGLPVALAAGLVLLLLLGWWVMTSRGGSPATVAGSRVVHAGAAPADTPAEPPSATPAAPAPTPDVEVAGGLDPTAVSAAPAEPEPQRSVPSGPPSARLPVAPPPRRASGGSGAAPHREGLRLFDAGRYAAAVPSLRDAVAREPANASYHNDLGWALFLVGRPADAARELREVIRLDPRREIAYANLGEVRLAQGDTADAVRQYRRFLELNTNPRREQIARRKLARLEAR